MFNDRKSCIQMLEGSYRKLKSYYYYNKNYVIIREKIAKFEADREAMLSSFEELYQLLMNPTCKESNSYFHHLLSQMDFCVLPKKFVGEPKNIECVTTNVIQKDKKLHTVNFFIDSPIELFILDTLWTLLLGKISYEQQLLSSDVYGNTLANHILYKDTSDIDNILDMIDFSSLRLFNIYFYKYCSWRNNAFEKLELNHANKKNSVLISLDIQSYYYNIKFNFNLREILGEHCLIEQMSGLTGLMQKTYKKYFDVVKPYRRWLEQFDEMEYPLPIGLFSSMLIANLYLANFDKKIRALPSCCYYGRYVDDLLFCFTTNIESEIGLAQIIQNTLVDNNILLKNSDGSYSLSGFSNLSIQKDKANALYISASESRALLDIYNERVRVIPSQMNILPDYDFKLEDFNVTAYSIENFGEMSKIRDIGNVNVDAFKVSRYFSILAYKQSNVSSHDIDSKESISKQIKKISDFFVGIQGIEYYSNWMNYAYFLVLARKYQELKKFYSNTKNNIESIKREKLDRNIFRKNVPLCTKTRDTLKRHLEICISTALALDIAATLVVPLKSFNSLAVQLMSANMFNHAFVSLPIANYMDYDNDVSYSLVDVEYYGSIPKNFERAFKVRWSPRFIHFEELLLALFLYTHNHHMITDAEFFTNERLVEIFFQINHIINQEIFYIDTCTNIIDSYKLQSMIIPGNILKQDSVTLAVGNIKMELSDCTAVVKDRWASLSRQRKQALRDLLVETYIGTKQETGLLVLPELFMPIYWLKEVVEFSKKSQIAIVTGLQYVLDNKNHVKNYVATILPFRSGKQRYKNAFVYIREKNDYSPLEQEELAQFEKYCFNTKIPKYQIFQWKGLDIATVLCFEFTDIFARALFKGKCDIVAAPVYNSDTTYFSNIIDSTVRDLHTFIVQANNSVYGDSRITGPYDRDNKDIFKIKGGENDHVIIGKINLDDVLKYQAEYYDQQEDKLKKLREKKLVMEEPRKKPNIKKLSARFNNERAKRKRSDVT